MARYRRTLDETGRYFKFGYTSVVNARLRNAKTVADDRSLRKKLEADNKVSHDK